MIHFRDYSIEDLNEPDVFCSFSEYKIFDKKEVRK